MLAVPEANSGHAAAAMTKLLVGVAVFITFLIGLDMMASIGIIGGGAASPTAQQEVPPNYLALYRSAADTCPGLPWSVLAAIGKVETNHGRLQAPGVTSGANFAGAAGPMQIGIGGKAGNTFGAYAVDGDGDGISNVYSTYEAATPAPWGGGPATPPNHDVAAIAIQFAYSQLGKPYVWGAEGDNFYDCSGLMQRAYKEAGVQLPRTSREQWYAGARVLDPGHLQPGDLVFGAKVLSDPSTIYHVGMYIGTGNMIVAPYTGAVVRVQPMIRNDYIGAVRPTAAA